MELIDNITRLLGDDLKATLKTRSRLKVAASCFSMYAYEALKAELEKIDELRFIFISPTFTASEVTDKIAKERKEFHIPKLDRERSLYGSEFEIQLRNKLTQRAIAKECADWMLRKARFKSNRTKAPMQRLLIYFKTSSECVSQDERSTGELNLRDKSGHYRKGRELMKWGGTSLRADRPNQFYGLPCPTGDLVLPYRNDGKEGHWRWGKDNSLIGLAQKDSEFFHWEIRPFDVGIKVDGKSERWVPYEKIRDIKKSVGWSTWLDKFGTNADGTRELKELFGFKVFDTPKPSQLIKWFLALHSDIDGIVLDFFAGSGSAAHATLELNAEDGGNRRFIMVQMPELCVEDSEAFKAGYTNIADIGKERIRRVGNKLLGKEKNDEWNQDVGFRVLKVDSSNMFDVYYTPDSLEKRQVDLLVDNIKTDRSADDLVFQVMLDWGVDLSLPIAKQVIQGKEVLLVDGNALAACFDGHGGIDESFVKELAKLQPLRVVFRDAGFKDSAVKINVEQIFKLLSPATEVKCI